MASSGAVVWVKRLLGTELVGDRRGRKLRASLRRELAGRSSGGGQGAWSTDVVVRVGLRVSVRIATSIDVGQIGILSRRSRLRGLLGAPLVGSVSLWCLGRSGRVPHPYRFAKICFLSHHL